MRKVIAATALLASLALFAGRAQAQDFDLMMFADTNMDGKVSPEAAAVPRHQFEASALLGRIYRDRGEWATAIEWFERASGAPAPSVEEARTLLEDLKAARAAREPQG